MRKLTILICLSLFAFIGATVDSASQDALTINRVYLNPCPTDNDKNRGILEEFLTEQQWSAERQETNTGHLITSQISVLQSSNESNACQQFNNQYQEAFTEEWETGGKKRDVTYYKVGSYYFVLISLRAPANPNVAGTGADFIHIYNSNVELVKAYAF